MIEISFEQTKYTTNKYKLQTFKQQQYKQAAERMRMHEQLKVTQYTKQITENKD